jgi:hypothetical protein
VRVLEAEAEGEAREMPPGEIGALSIKLPLPPGALPTLWQQDDRFVQSYLSAYPGYYQTADAGFIDDDGYIARDLYDFETSQGRSDVQSALKVCFADAHPADCVQRSLANLREVSAILDTKAPADAAAFKAWLRGISEKVAEAAAEGGFLSFGGVQVSDAEKATLADIAKALGTTA